MKYKLWQSSLSLKHRQQTEALTTVEQEYQVVTIATLFTR